MSSSNHYKASDKRLVALGGNAIHPEGIRGTGQEQFDIASEAAKTQPSHISGRPTGRCWGIRAAEFRIDQR